MNLIVLDINFIHVLIKTSVDHASDSFYNSNLHEYNLYKNCKENPSTPVQKFIINDLRLQDVTPSIENFQNHFELLKDVLNEKKCHYHFIAVFMNTMRRYSSILKNKEIKVDDLIHDICYKGMFKINIRLLMSLIKHKSISNIFPKTVKLFKNFVIQDFTNPCCVSLDLKFEMFDVLNHYDTSEKEIIVNKIINDLSALCTSDDKQLMALKKEVYVDRVLQMIRRSLNKEQQDRIEPRLTFLQIHSQKKLLQHGYSMSYHINMTSRKLIYERLISELITVVKPPKTLADELGFTQLYFNGHDIPTTKKAPYLIPQAMLMFRERLFQLDMTLPEKVINYKTQLTHIFKCAERSEWASIFTQSSIMVEVCLREIAMPYYIITKHNEPNNHHLRSFEVLYEHVKDDLDPINKKLLENYFLSEEMNFRNNAAHGLLTDTELLPVYGFIAFFVLYSILKLEFK